MMATFLAMVFILRYLQLYIDCGKSKVAVPTNTRVYTSFFVLGLSPWGRSTKQLASASKQKTAHLFLYSPTNSNS